VGADIYIYCPSGEEGAARGDLEYDLENFLGSAGEITGGGAGTKGYNIDIALADGEDLEQWISRLKGFLQLAGVRKSTFFEVFPPDWEPGMEWRRFEVFGGETHLTQRPK
jgi:hypothetical protein